MEQKMLEKDPNHNPKGRVGMPLVEQDTNLGRQKMTQSVLYRGNPWEGEKDRWEECLVTKGIH